MRGMTVSIFATAEYMGKRSGWTLSHLEMQKMLYVAHMFHLGRHGNPMIRGNFEAWEYGPVHPALYHSLKIFGSSPVTFVSPKDETRLSGTKSGLIDEVHDALSDARPGQLVAITHWDEGAWAKNYNHGVRGIPIPNEDIIEEYKKRAQRSEQ